MCGGFFLLANVELRVWHFKSVQMMKVSVCCHLCVENVDRSKTTLNGGFTLLNVFYITFIYKFFGI